MICSLLDLLSCCCVCWLKKRRKKKRGIVLMLAAAPVGGVQCYAAADWGNERCYRLPRNLVQNKKKGIGKHEM